MVYSIKYFAWVIYAELHKAFIHAIKTGRPPIGTSLEGNTKGGSITVPLTSGLTGLESAVWLLTIVVYWQNRLIMKNENNYLNSNIYSHLETYDGQSSNL